MTEYEFDDAETKQAALRSARRKIVVVDSSKLGAVSFCAFARSTTSMS